MVLVTALAAAFSLILVPASVVTTLAPSVLLAVAAAATLGAAVSTTLGAPDVSALLGLGSDMLGMVLLARLVLPPALTVAALAPLLAAGTDPNNLNTLRVSNAVGWSIIGVVAGVLWLRTRKPTTI
jgi:hypothetical protein